MAAAPSISPEAVVRSGFRHRSDEESLGRRHPIVVMAGLVPAIHAFSGDAKDVDARDKPAQDDIQLSNNGTATGLHPGRGRLFLP
jgi:hypothetical protein